MSTVRLRSIRSGHKFWLFASDLKDDYLVRGSYVRSLGKYACYIRGSVLTFVSGRTMVFPSLGA